MLLNEYDLLLLPLDFNEIGLKFSGLSFPTKASEFMLSGTPILVFAPKETALSKFFQKNNCGYCLTSQTQNDIIEAIKFLIFNEEYRKRISENAVTFAVDRFDGKKVRREFHETLSSYYNSNNV